MLAEHGPEVGPFHVSWELIGNAEGRFLGLKSVTSPKPRATLIRRQTKRGFPPLPRSREALGCSGGADLGKTLLLASEGEETV